MSTVFIHTNPKQRLGALVARYALQRHSRAPDRFDVRIISTEDFDFLQAYEGRRYRREGKAAIWRNDDLQSFTPLRFAVPALAGHAGRAVLTDPDVFAVGDINELLERDMRGAAILARQMDARSRRPLHYASSVMLLDCARLRHWDVEADFADLFAFRRDYREWMWLLLEAPGTVGPLESVWNDFDRLGPDTRLLHNTHRRTQPWKTGLPADFTPRGTTVKSRAGRVWRGLTSTITGKSGAGTYRRHPDPAQERFFFALLGECLEFGVIAPELVMAEIERGHIRTDALALARAHGAALPPPTSEAGTLCYGLGGSCSNIRGA